jgi:hypothetical protein
MTIEKDIGGHFFAAFAGLRQPYSAVVEVSCPGTKYLKEN